MTDTLWVAVGFVIFLGVVGYMGGFKTLFSGIDARATKISAELDEAKRLREEAQSLLASYKAKEAQAKKDADDIVAQAKAEADMLKADAAKKLEDFVTRRTKQAELKIQQAEQQATAEVRSAAAEMATQAASRVLAAQGSTDQAFAAALGEIKTKLN